MAPALLEAKNMFPGWPKIMRVRQCIEKFLSAPKCILSPFSSEVKRATLLGFRLRLVFFGPSFLPVSAS